MFVTTARAEVECGPMDKLTMQRTKEKRWPVDIAEVAVGRSEKIASKSLMDFLTV